MVFETALSIELCHAACIMMCSCGMTSCAVTYTSFSSAESSASEMLPSSSATSITFSISLVFKPAPSSAPRNSSLTSFMMTGTPSASFMTWRWKAKLNSGSMPPEQAAIIEIVPVGATVVTCEFRRLARPSICGFEPSHAVNGGRPSFSHRASEATKDSLVKRAENARAIEKLCSEP